MRLLPYPTGRALFLLPVEMILAVLQLRDAQRDRLGAFARELLHILQFLPQLLRVLDLRDDRLRDLFVALEKVQQLLAHVVDEFGADFRIAQLVLRLRLEDGVFEANGNCANHRFADIVTLELAVAILVHRLEQTFAERTEMRAAVAGVLPVDEGIKRLAVTRVAVGETELQRLARVMQR